MRVYLLLAAIILYAAASFQDLQATISNAKAKIAEIQQQATEQLMVFGSRNADDLRQRMTRLHQKIQAKLSLSQASRATSFVETPQAAQKRLEKESDLSRNELKNGIVKINADSENADLFYQGDIVLTDTQLDEMLAENTENTIRRRRQAQNPDSKTQWEDAKVYYYFKDLPKTTTEPTVAAIQAGIKFWQENTCIDFIENSTAPNRIAFIYDKGCYSSVGRVRGEQTVSIGAGCATRGTTIHEIGHALGFFHMMSRWDRDSAVRIVEANVAPAYLDQFDKETEKTNYNYDMPYDYTSIMQYGASSASYNSKPSVVALNEKYQDAMGSDLPAFYDVSMMNERYNCKAKCPAATSAKCENGGFASSRDCQKCICPRGFGGPNCKDRPNACGKTLYAQDTPSTLSTTLGKQGASNIDFEECYYFIVAPDDKVVEVTIESAFGPGCYDGCPFGGVEIKGHNDLKMGGFRFCCESDTNTTLTSPFSVLPVGAFVRQNQVKLELSYRAVSGSETTPAQTSAAPVVSADSRSSTSRQRTSTTARFATKGPRRCYDNRNCRAWVYYFDFCRLYPRIFTAFYCPNICGFC